MPFSTWTELKAKVASDYKRDDLTAEIVDAIALAEAEMQVECKLVEFETDSSISITAGSGPLPTGFLGMRAAYWDGNLKTPLKYVTPDRFDSLRNNSGDTPAFYTISGSTIRVNEGATGTVKAVSNVRFTPLSVSTATNDILTNFPNAYLYGSLKHLAIVTQDDASLQKYGLLFNAAMESIKTNNKERKYAGPLQVRAA
jgi:hypothetical protein